jgi:hypothetical protein
LFSFFSFLFLFFLYITLQNTISKQINKKNYIKITNNNPKTTGIYREHLLQAGTVFSRISGRENSGGASSHAPPSLAARLPKRHRHWRRVFPSATASNWKQRDRAHPVLPFLFLPAVTTTVICKKKENASKVSVLPPLLDLLSSSPFGFLLFPSAGGGRL